MSKELVKQIQDSYVQEIGNGAGKMLRAWTPVESELAEYAASLEAENARLTAELAEARGAWKTFVSMMEPLDECMCMEPPEAEEAEDEDDPSSHNQYCPVYLLAYAEAMAEGKDTPG